MVCSGSYIAAQLSPSDWKKIDFDLYWASVSQSTSVSVFTFKPCRLAKCSSLVIRLLEVLIDPVRLSLSFRFVIVKHVSRGLSLRFVTWIMSAQDASVLTMKIRVEVPRTERVALCVRVKPKRIERRLPKPKAMGSSTATRSKYVLEAPGEFNRRTLVLQRKLCGFDSCCPAPVTFSRDSSACRARDRY